MPDRESSRVVQIGEWIVHPALDSISRGAETQKLEPRAMRLLLCLANSAGAVVEPGSIYHAVSHLRKTLGDVDSKPTYIATVPRKGDRLVALVKRATETVHTAQAQAVERKIGLSLQVWFIVGVIVTLALVMAAYI